VPGEVCLTSPPHEITGLLLAWSRGDSLALDKLTPLVYEELHRTSRRYVAREQPDHTLQTTALINEVYLRLVDLTNVQWQDRAHFFALCASMMRRILIHVRQKILVYLTADPKTAMVIRRAKRVSDFLGGDCLAIAMQETDDLSDLNPPEREVLQKHLNFARNLHIETHLLKGDDASTLVDSARENGVTQIFLTRPRRRGWPRLISRDAVQQIIDLAKDMQIVIVSDRDPRS
jgi:RNA polymerase sigma factor (TIGR02999 family)